MILARETCRQMACWQRPANTPATGVALPCTAKKVQAPTQISLCSSSEEVGLLHDAQELLLVHLSIPITVSFIDHFLKLFVGHALAQLLCHALQVLEGYLSGLIVVKQPERFQDLVL